MTLFASDEVEQCPVCGKDACAQHRAACGYCGRHVCTADLQQPSRRCATCAQLATIDRKSTRLNSSHGYISYAVFCLKKKKTMTAKESCVVATTRLAMS